MFRYLCVVVLVATVGKKLGMSDAVLRRILNHTAPKADVLHRHYVALNCGDVRIALEMIQCEMDRLCLTVTPAVA